MRPTCRIRHLGTADFELVANAMMAFTDTRVVDTPDEIWMLQHSPVFTQGTSCHTVPRINPDNIPVVHSNRGGQITYHGPGQLIAYLLLDIKRLGLGPKKLVSKVEQSLIDLLGGYGLVGSRRVGAPGVYIDSAKIAALGLRIRRGMCFHGLSLNIAMNMQPFGLIDPCGIPGLETTQLSDHGIELPFSKIELDLLSALTQQFGWEAPAALETELPS